MLAGLFLTTLVYAAGEGTVIKIDVARLGKSSFKSSIDWKVQPTGEHPVDTADFVGDALPSGTLEFAPGEKTKTLEIQIRQDTAVESDETFYVVLSNPKTGSIINGERRITIVNDDEDTSIPLKLSLSADRLSKVDYWTLCTSGTINQSGKTTPPSCATSEQLSPGGGQIVNSEVSVDEGARNTSTRVYFTVHAARMTLKPYTVDYRVVGDGKFPADATDFGGTLPAGTITMNAPTENFSIEVQGDGQVEHTEGFKVELFNPTGGAMLGDAVVKGTIKGEAPDISPAALARARGAGQTAVADNSPPPLTIKHTDIKLFRVITLGGGTNPFDYKNLQQSVANAGKTTGGTTGVSTGMHPGLTLASSLPVVDNNGDDSQIILISIDSSDILSAKQGPNVTDSNTALILDGNPDVSFPGTAYIYGTPAFGIISPTTTGGFNENVNNKFILQRSNGVFYEVVLQFVQTGFSPGDMKLTSLIAYNCGTAQSGCP